MAKRELTRFFEDGEPSARRETDPFIQMRAVEGGHCSNTAIIDAEADDRVQKEYDDRIVRVYDGVLDHVVLSSLNKPWLV